MKKDNIKITELPVKTLSLADLLDPFAGTCNINHYVAIIKLFKAKFRYF